MQLKEAQETTKARVYDLWTDKQVADFVLSQLPLLTLANKENEQCPIYEIGDRYGFHHIAGRETFVMDEEITYIGSGGFEGTQIHIDFVADIKKKQKLSVFLSHTKIGLVLERDYHALDKYREPIVCEIPKSVLWSYTGLLDFIVIAPKYFFDFANRNAAVQKILQPNIWFASEENPALKDILAEPINVNKIPADLDFLYKRESKNPSFDQLRTSPVFPNLPHTSDLYSTRTMSFTDLQNDPIYHLLR